MAPVPLPAATVVLMRDRGGGRGGPEVLLVERHRESTVGAGAFVFPGGVLEPADCGPAALGLSAGLTPAQAAARMGDAAAPAEALGFFVAAIRETFEEALVLLAEAPGGGAPVLPPRAGLLEARRRMLAGELAFAEWVAGLGLVLATGRLVYFAHWITPAEIPQRFAARFFLVEVGPDVEVAADRLEVTRFRWVQPAEAIAMHGQGAIHLMDPTLRNLELLGTFASTREALRTLAQRDAPTIRPRLQMHPDGTRRLIYPWDADFECG